MQFLVKLCRFVLPLYQFFSQLFQKFVQYLQYPTLFKFLCSITFKNVQICYQNSIFVAETNIYTKTSSATKQCVFGI